VTPPIGEQARSDAAADGVGCLFLLSLGVVAVLIAAGLYHWITR